MERRQFIRKSITLGSATYLSQFFPPWVSNAIAAQTEHSNSFDLQITQTPFALDGRTGNATTVNGQLPAPLLRWKEGSIVTLRVTNMLNVDTSIHWHGIILPFQMDGVPGVSFPGIRPNESFTYTFPIKQSGTYWYHSHSDLQEQQGLYGPIIIDPAEPDPVAYDREYIIMLSDWSFEGAHRIFSKLKKMSDNYNFQKRTIKDFSRNLHEDGLVETIANRLMWGDMRMDPTDISDVTASTYSYLLNGKSSADNWTALFRESDRVRFRVINASAMTIFNFRIPDLPMKVVQADGLNIQPVEVDEFQIGVAETYDFVVSPKKERAYTIMAESIDRSGYVRGTLAPHLHMSAEVPALRARPLLTMRDMGMKHEIHSTQPTDDNHAHHHHHHGKNMGVAKGIEHLHPTGPGVMNVATHPSRRLDEPGLGLEDVPHRVLVYSDLKSLDCNPDLRAAAREITLHLTSNMERYMWSFDGKKFSESPEPIAFFLGERLRLTMVNDTMMSHPIHLHGMFFELVTGDLTHRPRKHTVIVKPAEILSVEITADAYGDWAFHCHLLYHMHAGMMRVVSVRERANA